MINELFAVKNLNDEKGNKIRLEYFLISNIIKTKFNIYGIEIVKYLNNCVSETEAIPSISNKKEFVENILKKAVNGYVMPSTLIYIIDDMTA